jgi:drug/metabolite transporter (DMT)-like permease
VLVVVASIAFATSGPLAKVASTIPAVVVATARTAMASIILALVARGRLLEGLRALPRRKRGGVALAGVLLAVHFVLFLGGIDATSFAAAVALVSLEPVAVVLAAYVAFGLRPSRRESLGLAIAAGGGFVVTSGAGTADHHLRGDLMVLGAVVLYAAYVTIARGLRDALPATAYAATVYGTSALVLLPFAIMTCVASPIVTPSAAAVSATVAMALVPTVIGHTLVQEAARRAPPTWVALVSPGETLGSLVLGALTLGTAPTVREAVGAFFILAGATLVATGQRPTVAT